MKEEDGTYALLIQKGVEKVRQFYQEEHPEIEASHGWEHVQKVHHHAKCAIESLADSAALPPRDVMEIELAALLHDVDDKKIFPDTPKGLYPNARAILQSIGVQDSSMQRILQLISWVGCSENGNSVPDEIAKSGVYHWLIPRWADRLEAVGARGVVRCYQYNQEKGRSLCSQDSPRPTTEEDLWNAYATPDRFLAYQSRGGTSTDMISHYYDKLLHIARPPRDIVRNPYLEQMAEQSSRELVEVCLRFGRTGVVDEAYIKSLMN